MITRKELYQVRLEVDFEVIAGELQVMERDLDRMPLYQFLQVYDPERRSARLFVMIEDIDKKKRKEEEG